MTTTAPDLDAVRSEAAARAAKEERTRIANITALCSKHGLEDIGRQLIEGGRSEDEARAAVLDKLGAKPIETVKPIEMADQEHIDYKISAGIRSLLTGD